MFSTLANGQSTFNILINYAEYRLKVYYDTIHNGIF